MDRQGAIDAMAVVFPEIERDCLGDILAHHNNDVERACAQLLETVQFEEECAIELAIAASLSVMEGQREVEQIAVVQIQRQWRCQRRIHKLRSLSLGNTSVDVRRRCLESLESAAAARKVGGRTSRMMAVGGSLKSVLLRATSRQRVGVGFEGVGGGAARERLIVRSDEADKDCEWQPPTLLLAATQAVSSSDSVQSSPRDVTSALHDIALSFDAAEKAQQKASRLLTVEERYVSRVGRAKAANVAKTKKAAAANSATPLLLATDEPE